MPAAPDISPDLNSLDAETLRAMVLAQRQELTAQREQLLARDTQIEHLKLLIIQLRRM